MSFESWDFVVERYLKFDRPTEILAGDPAVFTSVAETVINVVEQRLGPLVHNRFPAIPLIMACRTSVPERERFCLTGAVMNP